MTAAKSDRADAVKVLLQRGASAELTDCAGHTALELARAADARSAVDALLRP